VTGTCKRGNEPSGYIKCGEFLDWLRTGKFSRNTLLHGVKYTFLVPDNGLKVKAISRLQVIVVVGLLSYLFVTHYLWLFDDRGDGVKHVIVCGPVLLLVSRRLALYSLVLSGWLYVTPCCM